MVRTQIYLTERQRDELAAMARASGKKQSELIRDAVDRLIDQSVPGRQEAALRQAAGMWRDRTDLPDLGAIRGEWDRATSHGVGLADALLAATADAEGAEMKTLDVRPFPMLKGLEPAYAR